MIIENEMKCDDDEHDNESYDFDEIILMMFLMFMMTMMVMMLIFSSVSLESLYAAELEP